VRIIIIIIIIVIILLIWKMTQLHNLLKLQKTLVTMCFYKHLCQRGLLVQIISKTLYPFRAVTNHWFSVATELCMRPDW